MALNAERPAPAERGPSQVVCRAANGREDRAERAGHQRPIIIARISKGDGEVRIALDQFKGHPTIDVRLFESFSAAAVAMPTRKGVTLRIARLPALARALADAEAKARELGLIEGAA